MRRSLSAGLLGLTVWLAALPATGAHPGALETLFGAASASAEPAKAVAKRRAWNLREFTYVRLVPRETGSSRSEHPLRIDGEALRQLLAPLRIESREGGEPLFATDELAELGEPLVQALASAGSDDDVLLLSSSRRAGGLLAQPLAVTARLFVQGGSLHVIAYDTRFEFFNKYRGSGQQPEFTFGSRSRAGAGRIQSASGTSRRADWVALPLGAVAAAAVAPVTTSAPPAAVATTVAPSTQFPEAKPLPVEPPRARDAAFAEEIEQRLIMLKRLRDKGLISEEEYQLKRKEVLQLL
jgi:Short C-terminal domain